MQTEISIILETHNNRSKIKLDVNLWLSNISQQVIIKPRGDTDNLLTAVISVGGNDHLVCVCHRLESPFAVRSGAADDKRTRRLDGRKEAAGRSECNRRQRLNPPMYCTPTGRHG